MPEANDAGTYNVEAAETDKVNSDSNAANDADADNSGASHNAKDGVRYDIYTTMIVEQTQTTLTLITLMIKNLSVW